MTDIHGKTLDKMFEYNLWANTTLIKICSNLDDEQLEFEIEGAYGGIRKFLIHIVQAEGGYIRRMTGSEFWDADLKWDNLPLDTIRERAFLSGQKLIDIASKTNPDTQHEREFDGKSYKFFNWTVLAQAITHAMEHRVHVKVLLTQLGIEHTDLSLWNYMQTLQDSLT